MGRLPATVFGCVQRIVWPTWPKALAQRSARPRHLASDSTVPLGEALQEIMKPGRVHDIVNPRLVPTDGMAPSWVSDPGRLLPDAERSELNELCEKLSSEWKAEAAVAVLDSLAVDVQPTAFAAALLNFWGVGDRRLHTGLMVLLLTGQRRLEMRTGYGLARILPSEELQRIQQQAMVPHLAANRPGQALCEGLKACFHMVEHKAPKHWKQTHSNGPSVERNSHGFGGGQTPIDEFLPNKKLAPK